MTVDLVVIGLGYVGLPLACEASAAGLEVVGFHLAKNVITNLNSGHSHVDTVSDTDVVEWSLLDFVQLDLEAEIGPQTPSSFRVPTPLSPDGIRIFGAVRGAAQLAGRILSPGMLVVLEFDELPGDHR